MCSSFPEFFVTNKLLFRIRSRSFWIGIILFSIYLIPQSASAQLTEEDKNQIRVEAEKVVRELKELMDLMATKRGGYTYCKQARDANINKDNEDRIFWGKTVKIEDDVDPRYTAKFGAPLNATTYLYRLEQNFFPTNKNNAIEFDRIQTFLVDHKTYAFAKVYFRSKFNGTYRPTQKSDYIRHKRTVELRAVKGDDGRWKVYIDNIRFASSAEVASIYGGSEGLTLVEEIEKAQAKLEADLLGVESNIGKLIARIIVVTPGGAMTSGNIEDTRYKALSFAKKADSLANKSLDQTNNVKQIIALGKVKADASDSLFNEFGAQVKIMRHVSESYANVLDSIKNASQRVQTYLSDAELAYFIVDTLVTVINPRQELDEIMNSYYNASGVAKNAENASGNALKELQQMNQRLNVLKGGKLKSQEANRKAYQIQQDAQMILNGAKNDQRQVLNANRKAELLLSKADSMVIKLDELLGPLADGPQPLLDEILKTQIEDENYRLRTTAQDATDLAKSLNEAAISTNNKELIKEAATVVNLANDIYDKVDAAQKTFENARTQMENADKLDEKTESILDEIIQEKNGALAAIREARRGLSRSRYASSGTDRIIEKAKNTLAQVTQEKQEAIAANQSSDRYIRLVEQELQDIKKAYASTNRFSVDANENVNEAYAKVAKRSVEQRRHYTPYFGINYTGYRSSSRNLGQSPIFEGFGMDRVGFSLYYRVGAFFSNYGGFKDEIPETAYSMDDLQNEFKAMTGKSVYDGASLVQAGANLRHKDLGVYLSPIRHIYLKVGYTFASGTTWDYVQAPELAETNLIKAPGTEYFALNRYTANTGDFLYGVAFVWPYIQAEIGYNGYFNDAFVNFGINIPLRQTYTLKSTRSISRDEYDELMMEWKKNKR